MTENFQQKNDDRIKLSKARITPNDKGDFIRLYGIAINVSDKQKTKEGLFANEEMYKNLIESIDGAVYIMNENGIVNFISKSIQNVCGYKQNEVLGKNFLEFILEEDLSIAKRSFARLASEKNGLSEYRLKSKDGKFKFAKFLNTAIFNKSKFAGVVGIVIDNSESKKSGQRLEFQTHLLNSVGEAVFAINLIGNITGGSVSGLGNVKDAEDELLEAEKSLRDILDNSTIIFYSYTPDHVLNFVSPHLKQLLGFDPDGKKIKWTEFLTANPINQKGVELSEKAVKTGIPQEPYEIELRNNKKEFEWFEVHEIPVVKNGKTVLMVGSLTDITARVKAEEELQESQSLLINALEMANMGHWEYDLAKDKFTFNDQFYKMFHTSINEIGSYTMSLAEYVKRFVHPDDRKSVGREILRAIKTKNPNYYRELEHRIIYADGEGGTIAVRFNVVKDRNGKTIRTHGVNQDITKRKSIENELIEAKGRAEESNRLKSSFLGNMSHELRSPMLGILGFAEILKDELNDPSQIEMVSTIKNSGTRLIKTLNSILDLSRIEANKQDIDISQVNLNEIIKETIKLYYPIIKNKKIFLKYIFPERNVYLNSDKDLLQKIFNNLIDNAVKYTHKGGIVVKLIVQEKEPDKKILFEIRDTGIGIPKEFHNIIFEPFRQVSEGYSRKFEGSGLGLSITKKFIELLNGSIAFSSEPGKGSTFIVTFPYKNILQEINSNSENIRDNNVIINNPLNKLTVLLVEDDPSNASVISIYLKDYLKIDHVPDGKAALKICNLKKFDAVLMDINLKGIDGVETLKQIRKLGNHYSNIPVIAITAYAMSGDREKFLSLGFTHYISKPFDRPQLLKLLKEIFNE